MTESARPPADQSTELRRVVVVDGKTHALDVRSDNNATQIELTITGADGASLGSITGAIESDRLQVAADLLGSALTAAANAHAGKGFAARLRMQRLRDKHRNHGSRWSTDEDHQLTQRFNESASIAEMTDEFGRNENSIRARLVLLDLLPTEEWPIGARMPPSVLNRHNAKQPKGKRNKGAGGEPAAG